MEDSHIIFRVKKQKLGIEFIEICKINRCNAIYCKWGLGVYFVKMAVTCRNTSE